MTNETRTEFQPLLRPEDGRDLVTLLASAGGIVRSAQRMPYDEIEIVFGATTEAGSSSEPDSGLWRVGSQASEWRLSQRDTHWSSHDSARRIDEALAGLVGLEVTRVVPVLPQLHLRMHLSNGADLVIERDDAHGHPDFPDPPFWEVFTPDSHLIAAGPGDYWLRTPSNMPETYIGDLRAMAKVVAATAKARRQARRAFAAALLTVIAAALGLVAAFVGGVTDLWAVIAVCVPVVVGAVAARLSALSYELLNASPGARLLLEPDDHDARGMTSHPEGAC